MPEAGNPDPSFVTSGVVAATVVSSDGAARSVEWSLPANNGRLALTVAANTPNTATLQTLRGAPAGSVTLTAKSREDSKVLATASISVTDQGGLSVGVQ